MVSNLAPRKRVHRFPIAAVGTAGNDLNTNVLVADEAGVVSAVNYVPAAALSGANTNSRTLTLVNKGAAGSGTTVVATLTQVAGTDLAAAVPKAFVLSVVANATTVAAGDVLQFSSTHVGTGITDPGGFVEVTIDRAP